jgi:hypothetical protein
MAGPITIDGFAHASLSNVSDATLRARMLALGFQIGGGDMGVIADQPRILDYAGLGDFDKRGEPGSNSAAAFHQMVADCNANRVVGLVTPGNYRFDSAASLRLGPGSGLHFTRTGWDYNINAEGFGHSSAQLVIPFGPNRFTPPIAVHSGAIVQNPSFYYCDVIPRLRAGAYEIDVSAYPLIEGGPEVYAPAIVGDFTHLDNGQPGARNVGGVRIDNPRIIGGYRGIHIGDPGLDGEAWEAAYSTGAGKGVAGVWIEGTYEGFCLRNAFRIMRSGNLAQFGKWAFGGSFWAEAQQMTTGAFAGNQNPLLKWAQRNCNIVEAAHKFVGGQWEEILARNARRIFHLDAGFGAGPDGQDVGKYGHIYCGRLAAERVPIVVETSPTAYLHAFEVKSIAGHFMDYDDRSNADYAFEIRTDKTKAGSIQKRTTYVRDEDGNYLDGEGEITTDPAQYVVKTPEGTFKPQGGQTGWINLGHDCRIQELAGGLFRNTDKDGTTHWSFSGGSIGSWGQGARQGAADPMPGERWPLFVNRSAGVFLHHTNCIVQARQAGGFSDDVYHVSDPDKLVLIGNRYFGCGQIVVGHPDYAAWSACYAFPEATDVDEEGEGGDGDPADIAPGPDAP